MYKRPRSNTGNSHGEITSGMMRSLPWRPCSKLKLIAALISSSHHLDSSAAGDNIDADE